MKTSFLPLLVILGSLCGCFAPDYQKTTDLPGKVLSAHMTEARYEGKILRPCHFMTADCPNKCDHAAVYAVFSTVDYTDYQKLDKYGDEKQLEFFLRVADKNNVPDATVDATLLETIDALDKGDVVELHWAHTYVTNSSGAYPERIVTLLDR